MNSTELNKILQLSDVVVSWQQIDQIITRMAKAIDDRYAGQVPLALCIMNGGMMLTSHLMAKIKIQAKFDYLQTSRYRNNTRGGDLRWRIRPEQSLKGKSVLLMDDIFDEGYSLESIVQDCKAQGAEDVYAAVLLDKVHDRKVEGYRPDLVGLEVKDEYLVGFGMDYQGYFRHLPDIYSIGNYLAETQPTEVD